MNAEVTDEKLARILRQVRAMLAIAADDRAPDGERDVARNRAEALMFKYRLDEATAVASGSSSSVPIWRNIEMNVHDSEFSSFYYQIAGTIIGHVGCRGRAKWMKDEETGQHKVYLETVGYTSDLNYLDMLLTAVMLEFGKRLEPQVDPTLSDRDNIYQMRSAGMERRRIAHLIYGAWTTENEMKAKNRKVTAEFKKACAERGEDHEHLTGRGNSVKTYRRSFAEGFVSTFYNRLMRLRHAQGEEGSGLVLVSRQDKVNEAWYVKHPEDNPANRRVSSESGASQRFRRSRAVKAVAYNSAAAERGGAAAAMVDLGRGGTGKVSGSDTKAIG